MNEQDKLIVQAAKLYDHDDIINSLVRLIDRLDKQLKDIVEISEKGFYFICAHCSAQTYSEYDSIDSGTSLTCHSCKQPTVICLYPPKVYENRATFEAKSKKLRTQLQKMQALLERWMTEERYQPLWNPDRHKELVNDTEQLLKEAKEE